MKSLQLVVLIVLNSTLFMSLLTSFIKEKLPLYVECKVIGCVRVGSSLLASHRLEGCSVLPFPQS